MKLLMFFAFFYAILLTAGAIRGAPDVWLAANLVSGNLFTACWILLRAIKEPTP